MGDKAANKDKIGMGKFWGWQLRGMSVGCITIVLGYLSIYCTNTLMMPAALVGNLLLASKLFDGVTDILAGYIVDRTNTKLGKARPYEFAVIGVWISTWLLFSCSESWSMVAKSIWVFCMYTFVNSIFLTLCNTNQTAYMVRAFSSQNQIVKLNSYGGIIITIGCAIVSMIFPQLMATMATSGPGWSKMIAIFAIPLALIGMLRFLLVKETIQIEDNASQINLSGLVTVLKKNKYIYIVFAIALLYNLTLGMNAATYYFTDVVGDIGKYTMIAALSMPMMLVMFIFPVAMKKYSTAQIIMFAAVIGAAGGLMNFFAGANMPVLMIAAVFVSFAGLPIAYLSTLLILDCAAYNEKIGLARMDSVMSAFQSFASKIGQGLGAAMLGWMLSAGGYDGTLEVQGSGAVMSIRILYGIAPMIIFALVAIFASRYKLDKVVAEMDGKAAGQA